MLADYRKPEDLIGEYELLKQLTTLLVEKALEAEMADHLGHSTFEQQLISKHQTRWTGFDDKTLPPTPASWPSGRSKASFLTDGCYA